jgi:hypothetical protein
MQLVFVASPLGTQHKVATVKSVDQNQYNVIVGCHMSSRGLLFQRGLTTQLNIIQILHTLNLILLSFLGLIVIRDDMICSSFDSKHLSRSASASDD